MEGDICYSCVTGGCDGHDHSDGTMKIVLLGDCDAGKTSIAKRICNAGFGPTRSTICVDFNRLKVNIGKQCIEVALCDTAGMERFRSITKSYYKDADGVALVYNVTDVNPQKQLHSWKHEINAHCPEVAVVVLGNKSDLTEEDSFGIRYGREFAEKENYAFFDTSALSCYNVHKAFQRLIVESVARYLAKRANDKENKRNRTLSVEDDCSRTCHQQCCV